jgi:hypothetical protein
METRSCLPVLALALAVASPLQAGAAMAVPGFFVAGRDAAGWTALLRSVGLQPQAQADARVLLAAGEPPAGGWRAAAAAGRILIVEGDSPAARELGFRATRARVRVRQVRDRHAPELAIVWQKAVKLPVFELPAGARVVAEEREHHAPLVAVLSRGAGGVLWLAAAPGPQGYERFPYLLQALAEAGVAPIFEGRRLWAFYDSAYQREIPPEELARQWRQMGLAAIHVGAWDYFEPNPEADAFLRKLVDACHEQGIRVYAWLELPHVSTGFWHAHPEWREKTGPCATPRSTGAC